MTLEGKKKFLINMVYYAVIAVLLYFVFKFLLAYLFPFIIGVALAALVQKPAIFISKKTKIKSGICASVFVFVFYGALVTLIGLLGVSIYNGVSNLVAKLPEYAPAIAEYFGSLGDRLSEFIDSLPSGLVASIDIGAMPDTIVKTATETLTRWLSTTAANMAKSAPSFLITVIVTVVASCYIAKDYQNIKKFFRELLTEKFVQNYKEIRSLLFDNFFKLIRGYLLLMLITFGELALGLTILGYPYSIAIAAIIAVVDILPVLGTGTVVLPWALIRLISGDVWQALALVILYIVITFVRNFLEPRIIGQQVGLHPLLTLITMFIGLRLFGFFGMFALPLALIILIKLYKNGKISLDKI